MLPMEWAFYPSSSCPALCRASTSYLHLSKQDVDGRDEPGHDEKRLIFKRLEKSLKMLAAF
jgi:hypothetical protein